MERAGQLLWHAVRCGERDRHVYVPVMPLLGVRILERHGQRQDITHAAIPFDGALDLETRELQAIAADHQGLQSDLALESRAAQRQPREVSSGQARGHREDVAHAELTEALCWGLTGLLIPSQLHPLQGWLTIRAAQSGDCDDQRQDAHGWKYSVCRCLWYRAGMKKYLTPLLIVAALLVGLGIRYAVKKRSANQAQTAQGLVATPDEESEDPRFDPTEDQPREDPESAEDWETKYHPPFEYPPEVADAKSIKIDLPKGRAEHPLDDMVTVAAGEFVMGDDHVPFSAPRRKTFVKAFKIDRYEVTNEAYQAFVIEAKHRQPELMDEWAADYSWRENQYPEGTKDQPVVLVSYVDAQKYCNWRGARLPIEAEWEKAARGTTGRVYPWGDKWDGRKSHTVERLSGPLTSAKDWEDFEKNFDADQLIRPFAVGSYPEDISAFGVVDAHGNVQEWVDDLFEAPEGGDAAESELYTRKDVAIAKGTSFVNRDYAAPLSARFPYKMTHRETNIGFRCAKDI